MRPLAEVLIRPEQAGDAAAIRAVIEAAFGQAAEAVLVERLRAAGALAPALVALEGNVPVGHVAFSPVTLDGAAARALGLAPLAVRPDRQRAGIGSALVRAGLAACQAHGAAWVCLVGEPTYYARFGFVPAAAHGLRWEHGAAEAFMLARLDQQGPPPAGIVRYRPEFDGL